MAWIQLDQTLFTHRKTILTSDALGIPEVHLAGHLAALWSWAMDHAADGNLPPSSRVIARAAQYEGDASAFCSALIANGFIDDRDGAWSIHDWTNYSGKLHITRSANADRMRASRAASPPPPPTPAPEPQPIDPQPTTRRHRARVAVEPQPASENIPYAMWQAWIDAAGQDESEAAPSYKSKQLAFAKRIADDGFAPDDVSRCFAYLQTDPFWSSKGIDLQVIQGQIGKWAMAGKPISMPTPITRATTGRAADVRSGLTRLHELGS